MGKTKEVIALLRHLPYIRQRENGRDAQGAGFCHFADRQDGQRVLQGPTSGETFKLVSEDPGYLDDTPAHVIGLTSGGGDNPIILLDMRLGIVGWVDCIGEIRDRPTWEVIIDDPYDYAAENEKKAEWRADALVWAISDFSKCSKINFGI